MDFTREPVIETVVTPREGCKLVVRSSKSSGQEEYFVDAVEVVSFGHSLFFRSLERPKAFLVPVSDYEILEVREARMILKNVGGDRSIKIGGGRETAPKLPKEPPQERREPIPPPEEEVPALAGDETLPDSRLDKKRGRRHYRRRRGRDDSTLKEAGDPLESPLGVSNEEGEFKAVSHDDFTIHPHAESTSELKEGEIGETTSSLILSSILPPPPTLISETIKRYKENAMFEGAFFVREEKEKPSPLLQEGDLAEPHKEAWISDEAEEEIFRHRAASLQSDEISEAPHEPHKEGHPSN